MTKLPVFKTVGQVFGFVVERRFFTLLRLIWFPSFLSVIAGLGPAIYQWQTLGINPTPEQTFALFNDPNFLGLYAINIVASFLLSAIIAVCVHRLIFFEDTRPGVFLYVRLTGDEWRYMAAYILYTLLIVLALGGPLFAFGAMVASGSGFDPAMMPELVKDPRLWAAVALGFGLMFIALARFGLVFPVIVAEERLSFGRSWQLTRGNFWRLIGFWIVVFVLAVILILVLVAILAVAVGAMVGAVMMGGETVGALGIVVFAVPAAVSLLVYVVVGIALFIAALSFCYKALAGPVAPTETFE